MGMSLKLVADKLAVSVEFGESSVSFGSDGGSVVEVTSFKDEVKEDVGWVSDMPSGFDCGSIEFF